MVHTFYHVCINRETLGIQIRHLRSPLLTHPALKLPV